MGSTSLTAANVMDRAASLMNDTARTVYTYEAQMPYLNMALTELQEHFQLTNIPITNETSAAITIPVGTTEIIPFDEGPGVHYPQDLIDIVEISERDAGSDDNFIPLTRKNFLDSDTDRQSLAVFVWEGQKIKFPEVTTAREVRIKYIKTLFPRITNHAALLGVMSAESFLFYRTAALCTRYIGENPTRADSLDSDATGALDRVTGIGTKSKQSITTRRRPFMASYKRRG